MVIEKVTAGSHTGWLVDSDCAAVRMQSVRLEGQAGIMRNTGVPYAWPTTCPNASSGNCGPIADGRFTDILIDVSDTCECRSSTVTSAYASLLSPPAFCHAPSSHCAGNAVDGHAGGRPANDTAISFDKPGQLHLIGGNIGSRVMLGNKSSVYQVGVRFQYGGHIAASENTSGATVYAMQSQNETAELRSEVSELRREVAALRQLVLPSSASQGGSG